MFTFFNLPTLAGIYSFTSRFRERKILSKMNNIAIVFVFFCNLNTGFARYYYCSDKPQDLYTLTEVNHIVTVREGDQHYAPNATCEFPIETMDSRRIKLSVELSDLHTPAHFVKSYCEAYDHVEVFDGENNKLVTWCGNDHPKEIISEGKALKVMFKSNKDNGNDGQFRGIRIRIQTFDNTTCPPGWLEHNNSCYATTLTKQSWVASQVECNQRQSNLLSLNFSGSLTFLFKEILNESAELFLWTGLNGVMKDDRLVWVDKTSPVKIPGFKLPSWDDRRRCGVIHTKLVTMYLQDCSHNAMYALCQAKKNQSTPLYPTKVKELTVGVAGDDSGQILLGVMIPIIILVLLVVGVLVAMDKFGQSFSCPFTGGSDSNVA